jgi:hypothetical protein
MRFLVGLSRFAMRFPLESRAYNGSALWPVFRAVDRAVGRLGKAIVASVQKIASIDAKQSGKITVSYWK